MAQNKLSEKEIILRILAWVKPYKGKLIIAVFSMVLVAGFSGAQAALVKPVLDKIFIEKNKIHLHYLPLAIIVVFLGKSSFYYAYSILLEKVGQNVIMDLRKKIFKHIHSLSISYFHKTPTGELISRVIADVALIQGAVSNALIGIIKDTLQAIVMLGVIFYMSWKLALFSTVFILLCILPIIFFGRLHRKYSLLSQQTTAEVSNVLYETITGHRIVKAFCMEEYEQTRFGKIVAILTSIFIKDASVKNLSHGFMEFIGGVFFAGVIFFGGLEVFKGNLTPGDLFSFLTALGMLYEPVKGMSRINVTIQQGIAAATRVFSVLDIEPEIKDKPNATVLPALKNEIVFNNVSFSYDGKSDILKNINLNVKAGEVLAIAGPSGGGKTTLVNLIPRFFDVSKGSITIDGKNICDATVKSLRGQIAMVTQQTILFNDTIRNNIAYGDQARTDDEIKEAAKMAHALGFIQRLPEGFDTIIGESGAKLSGGQRQRLSIARALLKNAPILILDEATSALDTESEREVQKALENLMRDRTTFVIAHRLSTIRNADRIIVMQEGQIVEEGPHDTLIKKKGVYEMLHSMQR